MHKRISISILSAVLAAGSGCKSTARYAVFVPRDVMDDRNGCFRECQAVRSGGTENYIGCLRSCPDVRVIADKECENAGWDSGTQCMEETVRHVSAGKTVWLVIILVAGAALAAGGSQQ